MNDIEINEFIERMEELGDVWEYDQVKRVYGDETLEYALKSRMSDMSHWGNIVDAIYNRDNE